MKVMRIFFEKQIECTLELLDWNSSQEPCNVSLDVFHRFPELSLQHSLQPVNKTNSYGTNSKAWIISNQFHFCFTLRNLNFFLHLRQRFRHKLKFYTDVSHLQTPSSLSHVLLMLRSSGCLLLHGNLPNSLNLKLRAHAGRFHRAIVRRPERGSMVTSSWSSLKALCYIMH